MCRMLSYADQVHSTHGQVNLLLQGIRDERYIFEKAPHTESAWLMHELAPFFSVIRETRTDIYQKYAAV